MPLSAYGIQLCLSGQCSGCEKSKLFLRSRAATEQWLTRMSLNPGVIPSLHAVAVECGIDRVNLLNNRAVIRAIAAQLASGRLRVCDKNWKEFEFDAGGGTMDNTAPPEDAKPFPLEDRLARTVSQAAQQAAADDSTFSDGLNPAAQAQALASAAAQGVPFCPE